MPTVTLSWNHSGPVDEFIISRRVSIQPYAEIGRSAVKQFVDSTVEYGTNYQYKVQARLGLKLSTSTELLVIVPDAPSPEPVTDLTAVVTL